MAISQIIQLDRSQFDMPGTKLRQPCHDAEVSSPETDKLICDLTDTLNSNKIAVGLSAPQLGILKRIFVVNIKKAKCPTPLVFINPEITNVSCDSVIKMEACMSLPGYQGPVSRPKSISVTYYNQEGIKEVIHASGFLARVICHEQDHLDGILYVDRMPNWDALEVTDLFDKA